MKDGSRVRPRLADRVMLRVFDPMLRPLRLAVARSAGVTSGERVLDICCGAGSQVLSFAAAGAEAVGVDRNPVMLRWARERAEADSLSQVSFQLADATDLPFRDGTFDCVCISLALHEMSVPERMRTIEEMKRVAGENARLVFADWHVPLPKNLSGRFVTFVERVAGWENHMRFRHYLRSGGIPALLRDARLHPERVERFRLFAVVVAGTGAV